MDAARRTGGGHSSSSSGHSYSSRSYTSHSSSTPSSHSTSTRSKPEHVSSYTRKNGTVVHSYNQSNSGTAPKHYSATRTRTSSGTHTATSHYKSQYLNRSSHRTVTPAAKRDSHGKIKRSEAEKDAFKRSHPCPSTGKSSGACPGYVIDHVQPLSKGGTDAPSNMQLQTTKDAKAKDKWERR